MFKMFWVIRCNNKVDYLWTGIVRTSEQAINYFLQANPEISFDDVEIKKVSRKNLKKYLP